MVKLHTNDIRVTYEYIQSTLVISNSHGTDEKVRHSECSRYRVFEITDASDVKVRDSESFEIEKKKSKSIFKVTLLITQRDFFQRQTRERKLI